MNVGKETNPFTKPTQKNSYLLSDNVTVEGTYHQQEVDHFVQEILEQQLLLSDDHRKPECRREGGREEREAEGNEGIGMCVWWGGGGGVSVSSQTITLLNIQDRGNLVDILNHGRTS